MNMMLYYDDHFGLVNIGANWRN